MTMTSILKVKATKVLRVKTFAIGKVSMAISTTTLTAIKSKKLLRKP